MPLISYRSKDFGPVALMAIGQANKIIAKLQDAGYDLTLRQIYYVFVAQDLFPDDRTFTWDDKKKKWFRDPKGTKNAEPNYDWLGELLNDARLAGRIDWHAMTDRTRVLKGSTFWESPKEIVDTIITAFRMNPWDRQPNYVEAWVEKDALIGVLEKAAFEMRVPYFSCRGYTSQSEMWKAAQRLGEQSDVRNTASIVIHRDPPWRP